MTEHLRDSIGVIRQLFNKLNISSSTDLCKPLFVDTSQDSSSMTGINAGGPLNTFMDSLSPQTDKDQIPSNPLLEPSILMPKSNGLMSNTNSAFLPVKELDISAIHPSNILPVLSGSNSFDSNQLVQQQEALSALFSNPLISALLNSTTGSGTEINDLLSILSVRLIDLMIILFLLIYEL